MITKLVVARVHDLEKVAKIYTRYRMGERLLERSRVSAHVE